MKMKITLNDNLSIEIIPENGIKCSEILKGIKNNFEEALKKAEREEEKVVSPIWSEIDSLEGFWISDRSEPIEYKGRPIRTNTNVFITEKYAKRAIAEAQISQLLPYYGGEITQEEWAETYMPKYCIVRNGNNWGIDFFWGHYRFIAFRTEEDRKRFISRPENVKLIEDYFML